MTRWITPALAVVCWLTAAPARSEECSWTLVVDVPATTPDSARIVVRGDHAALGAWAGGGLALTPIGRHVHAGTLRLPRASQVEFKVTRGGWESVEKDSSGGEISNRVHRIERCPDTLRVRVATWRDQVGGDRERRVSSILGTVRRHPGFASRHVLARDVVVWLPPGYDRQPDRRYPVAYMLDGQNVLDGATSFIPGAEWRADETADQLIRTGEIPPLLIVAVSNSARREDDYTSDVQLPRGGGRSAEHQRFLVEELKPFIDGEYRTRPGPETTAIIGSSLGGLAALDLGLAYPGIFGRIGSVSPSVWWSGRAVLGRVRSGHGAPGRIWMDMGDAECAADADGRRRCIEDARELRDALLARGYRVGENLVYREFPGARHDERAWASRLPEILRTLFGPLR